MLTHSETERLGFIQISTIRGSWGNLFKTTITAAYGYTIVVFRDKYYVGLIAVEDTLTADHVQQQLKSMKVQSGDTLIWVSLTPRKVDMNVPLTTIDGNYPVCKLTLMLKVDKNRARDFANLFNQNNDPVEMVKSPIVNALQRYARQRSYNELGDDDMRHRVLQSLYGENKQYGVIVESIPHLSVPPDEHIAQRIQITQEADTQALQDRLDQDRTAQQSDFTRRQASLQNNHQRKEQDLDNAHRRRQELQDSLHQPVKEGLTNRLRRDLNAGKSLYHIMDENPDIQDIYAISPDDRQVGELPWQERARLAPGSMSALERRMTESNIIENEDEQIPGLSQQQRIVFHLRKSGITVLRVQLSSTQRNKAGIQTLTAMLVCQVDADDKTFAVGDLITMVEGIAVTDIEVLVTILKEKYPAMLSARILRGEESLDANIQSIE